MPTQLRMVAWSFESTTLPRAMMVQWLRACTLVCRSDKSRIRIGATVGDVPRLRKVESHIEACEALLCYVQKKKATRILASVCSCVALLQCIIQGRTTASKLRVQE